MLPNFSYNKKSTARIYAMPSSFLEGPSTFIVAPLTLTYILLERILEM